MKRISLAITACGPPVRRADSLRERTRRDQPARLVESRGELRQVAPGRAENPFASPGWVEGRVVAGAYQRGSRRLGREQRGIQISTE